jgi:hypothetical protein
MASIGLLMIVPDAQALECYVTNNASATSAGGRAAWEMHKMFRIATGGNEENPLELSIHNGNPTMQCPWNYPYCSTIHCAKISGMFVFLKINWPRIKDKSKLNT